MHRCRICLTECNLKYSAAQLRQLHNKDRKALQRSASPFGNICFACDERRRNFHEDQDSDSDVDVVSVSSIKVTKRYIEQRQQHAGDQVHTQRQHSLGLGSDGDSGGTDVIELFTSRESTPFHDGEYAQPATTRKSASPESSNTPESLCAVDRASTSMPPADVVELSDSDDEEIVFCRVENNAVTSPKKTSFRSNCSANATEDDSAVISLLSSDSETDEQPTPKQTQKQLPKPLCSPDRAKKAGEQCLPAITCPVCKTAFISSAKLVYHMRCNHRNYQGEVLSERSRYPLDSAMTIRLRYMQRLNYYECQLCGRIDGNYKEHKQHIMEKHRSTSKSLKDPMMKTLKCPVCQKKCGMEYLLLCSHLLNAHIPVEYQAHVKELADNYPHRWNNSRKNTTAMTAKVYQLTKPKKCFIQCKFCGKMTASFSQHCEHAKTHNWKSAKRPSTRDIVKTQASRQTMPTLKEKNHASNKRKSSSIVTAKRQIGGVKRQAASDIRKEATISSSLDATKTRHSARNESKQLSKRPSMVNMAIDRGQGVKSQLQAASMMTQRISMIHKNSNELPSKKPMPNLVKGGTVKTTANRMNVNLNKRPSKEETEKSKLSAKRNSKTADKKKSMPPSALMEAKPDQMKNTREAPIAARKLTKKQVPAVGTAKMKVKLPQHCLDTQKYGCEYCGMLCMGFIKMNLHMLTSHNSRSMPCHIRMAESENKTQAAPLSLHLSFKQRRKHAANICKVVDENCNTDCKRKRTDHEPDADLDGTSNSNALRNAGAEDAEAASTPLEPDKEQTEVIDGVKDNKRWLHDLLQMHENRQSCNNGNARQTMLDPTDSANTACNRKRAKRFIKVAPYICGYCGQLYADKNALREHEDQHEGAEHERRIYRESCTKRVEI